MLLPLWLAVIEQVPAAIPVTVEPLTVQIVGVVLVKTTASPELDVALAVVVPHTLRLMGLKLIVPMVCTKLLSGKITATGTEL